MTDDPKNDTHEDDIQRLAKEYVDLWESQFKALAGDETLAKTMAQTMELMNAGAANVAAMMQRAASSPADGMDIKGAGDVGGKSGTEQNDQWASPNAAATGAASGSAKSDVSKLTRRVAELEERLTRLEGLSEPSGKMAPKKSKKS